MIAFEQVVARVLEQDGYWTRTSFKVQLTPAQKAKIGRTSSPRWEIDVLAYRPGTNDLLVVECKSYLDSRGVLVAAVDGSNPVAGKRFKLFNDPVLRKEVLSALVKQLKLPAKPTVTLCLAAGRIATEKDLTALLGHFAAKKWRLITRADLRDGLKLIGEAGYENDQVSIVAKLMSDEPRRRVVRRTMPSL
jgi:hypothetical protein